MAFEHFLFIGSTLVVFGVLASKVSDRLGVPALLLFLGIGMLAGSEGLGGIAFDDFSLAQSVGVLALAHILFAGGFETRISTVRPVARQGISLATFGVFFTALAVGGFATLLLDFSWLEGMLLGAIVSSTDAAAVFSVLRSRGANLKGNLRPLLELESGTNDPMAVFLTIGVLELLQKPSTPLTSLLPIFVLQMGLGALLGLLMGRLAVHLINRINLGYEGLYPVLTLSLVTLIYSTTALLGGGGFLAVYLAGMVLGNHPLIHQQSLLRFHDGMAWLMQIAMFLTLGLLVFPSHLVSTAGVGTLLALLLIFVARPIGVFLSLSVAKISFREKLLVSWVGLRGSVPVILATFPLVAGVEKAVPIFNIVFFIVLLSVSIQGPSLAWIARKLDLVSPSAPKRPAVLELSPLAGKDMRLEEIQVPPDSPVIGKRVLDLHLPPGILLVLLNRDQKFLVPRGNTELQPGDEFTVAAEKARLAGLRRLFHQGIAFPPEAEETQA